MSQKMKKVIYSLWAAAVSAAAAGLFCLFTAQPAVNGRSLIYFTERSSQSNVVDTEISRSVSALRRAVTDDAFLEKAVIGSVLSPEEIKEALSVVRLGNSSGAEIILSGLDKPSEAPIILMNILYLAENSPEIPSFKVISGCELSSDASLPQFNIIAGAGLAGLLVCYIVMSAAAGRRGQAYRPERADTENDYQSALFMQQYIEDACKAAVNLGELPLTAPDGLEKSGYIAAAQTLAAAAEKSSARIIAVAPDTRRRTGEIQPAAKIAAYLACAFAELGKRTVLIDCDMKAPSVMKIFKKTSSNGLSDFLQGSCPIWDILSVNARKGVDVITEKKGNDHPAKVFSSPEYERLLEFLSTQYDHILLCAPCAWECSEWGAVTKGCRGYVVVCGEETVGSHIAKEILGQKSGFIALCSVKAPESEEKKPDKK